MAKTSLKIKLFTVFFYARLILVTVLFCATAGICFVALLPFKNSDGRRRIWRTAIKCYGKTVLALSGYPFIKIIYKNLAPEEKEPGVVVMNHRSGSDGFLVAYFTGGVVQVVNDWPFKLPFLGFFARQGEYFNIRAMTWDEFLAAGTKCICDEKFSLVGFPEGTRSGCKEMGPFHGALFRLAQQIKKPLYPVLILGNEKIPDLNFVVHPGTIRIYKLPAVQPELFADWTPFKFKNYVRELMQSKMAELENQ